MVPLSAITTLQCLHQWQCPLAGNFSNDALETIISFLGSSQASFLEIDDGPTISGHILHAVYAVVSMTSSPIINWDQFEKNVTKKSASGFADLLRKALGTNDFTLWLPVVTHGVSP